MIVFLQIRPVVPQVGDLVAARSIRQAEAVRATIFRQLRRVELQDAVGPLVVHADVLVRERHVVPARLVAVLHALAAVGVHRVLHAVDARPRKELAGRLGGAKVLCQRIVYVIAFVVCSIVFPVFDYMLERFF